MVEDTNLNSKLQKKNTLVVGESGSTSGDGTSSGESGHAGASSGRSTGTSGEGTSYKMKEKNYVRTRFILHFVG